MLCGTIGGTSSVRETDILLTEDQCSSVLTAMPTRRNVIVVDIVVVRSTGNTSITALEKLEQHPGREVRPLYLGCISFLFRWRDLWGVGTDNDGLGEKLSASLPNIKGGFRFDVSNNNLGTATDNKFEGVVWGEHGSFGSKTNPSKKEGFSTGRIQFDASRILQSEDILVNDEAFFDASASNPIYQDDAPVRPNSYGVIFWKRTA